MAEMTFDFWLTIVLGVLTLLFLVLPKTHRAILRQVFRRSGKKGDETTP